MNDSVRIYLVDEYCEGASHFCFSERKDVVLFDDYEKLRAENERLNRELKQTEAQDQVVFDGLRKENAKLCCLALHAMSELFYWLQNKYFRDGTCALSWEEKEMLDKRGGKYLNLRCKYLDAYRKAKKALMEEK